jgi:hypothetical protein
MQRLQIAEMTLGEMPSMNYKPRSNHLYRQELVPQTFENTRSTYRIKREPSDGLPLDKV